MKLDVRRPPSQVPSYSLTGDILSYARCGLQYRFHRVGALPASRPVQMWFGQFLHGVLEEGFRRFQENRQITFDQQQVDDIADLVKTRLGATGLRPRNRLLDQIAHYRAGVLLGELAPLLFPVINQAEVRLTATRSLGSGHSVERYQMTGVVDVISSLDLAGVGLKRNPLIDKLAKEVPEGSGQFEVIVDYKGMGRPAPGTVGSFDQIYDWQILTYAELRHRQVGAQPVAAAALLYLNELAPTWEDVHRLARSVRAGRDAPPRDPVDQAVLKSRSRTAEWPQLSLAYRIDRAVKVVHVAEDAILAAATEFDRFAAQIEDAKQLERSTGSITSAWTNYSEDDATCAACDFRTMCPKPRK